MKMKLSEPEDSRAPDAGAKDVLSNQRGSARDRDDRAEREEAAEVSRLLRRYRSRPTIRNRNLIVERFRPQVELTARALAARLPRCVDVHDLVHAGIWGLLQAIESFRPERGRPFPSFMRMRVRGAMLDELRNMDYLPRLYRQLLRDREHARAALRLRFDRDPNDAELAAELGVSEARLRRVTATIEPFDALRLRGAQGSDDAGEGVAGTIDSLPDLDLESPIEALNRRDLLAKIESSLQPIEWKVLELHYFEGLSGKEVARRLRLSASRICQIHGRVLSRLKSRLAAHAPS
jgi:RNA polymerase sigma factor for flagellar operon FliA